MTRTAKRIVAAALCCALLLGLLAAVGFVSAHRAREEQKRRQSIVDSTFTQAYSSAVSSLFYREDLSDAQLASARRNSCERTYFALQILYLSSYSQNESWQELTAALQKLAHDGVNLSPILDTEGFGVLQQIFRRLPYSDEQVEAALTLLKEHFPDL